jgi:hypothetical protein
MESEQGLNTSAAISGSTSLPVGGPALTHIYQVDCIRPDGSLRWSETVKNLVPDAGLDEILSRSWKASALTVADHVGLMDGTPTVAAGDTMAAHAGWVEVTDYDEATREALTLGAVSGQSVDNSASKASYAINATVTIGGAFICDNNTKGGATGTLLGAAAFTAGDRAAQAGDTLNLTITLTAASA